LEQAMTNETDEQYESYHGGDDGSGCFIGLVGVILIVVLCYCNMRGWI